MNRNIICITRLFVDSIPKSIRNSKLIFKLARYFFKIPNNLYLFRKDYKEGKINNLREFYINRDISLQKITEDTDINSFHLRLIFKYLKNIEFKSVLDVGCGNAFLLKSIRKKWPAAKITGIDYEISSNLVEFSRNNKRINFIEGDVSEELKKIGKNSFDIIFCTHLLEHLREPKKLILEMRELAKKRLIIICPLEKELIWGMNYHVNFYPNSNAFLNDLDLNINTTNKYFLHKRLGDLMYIEIIKDK